MRTVNGHHGADHVHHAEHVDVEIGADFGVGELFNRADKDVASVVHGYVYAPEAFGDGGDAAADVGFIGELTSIARGGGDAVSCGKQGFDERESETAGRAGYEPDWGWVLQGDSFRGWG